jgi:peptidyl-prolyl cis-trans isomerase A (cyclophilin A)
MASNPVVLIKTKVGDIKVELYPDKAPITVTNFLKYTENKLYDGTSFFRTVTMDNQPTSPVKIEVIQGGQVPKEKEYPPIEHETTEKTGLKHKLGTISMSRGKPSSATSSFFFCIRDEPELDYGGNRNADGQGFSAFGTVISGMGVVKKIHQSPKEAQRLIPVIEITEVT